MHVLVNTRRGGSCSNVVLIFLRPETEEIVSRHLEAEPRTGHRRRDLKQVRADAFVQSSDAFLCGDDANGVKDALILVAHTGHGIDLKAATENITVTDVSNPHAWEADTAERKLTADMCKSERLRQRSHQRRACQRPRDPSRPQE